MTFTNSLLRGTTIAASIGLGLTATSAMAQEAQSGDQKSVQEATQQSQADQKVATVNGTEIVTADVRRFVETLPDQMRQAQPPEMLISSAIQQLVVRELILEEARSEDLAEDAEVKKIVEQTSKEAQDDAMIQVWLQRELEDDVTDENVQGAYDALAAASEQELPPLDKVRPQIEQQLRQQAFAEVRASLQKGAEITFFNANGEPLTEEEMSKGQNSDASDNGKAAKSGGSSDKSSDSSDKSSDSYN